VLEAAALGLAVDPGLEARCSLVANQQDVDIAYIAMAELAKREEVRENANRKGFLASGIHT
jgi:hypothetical protein